MTLNVKDYGAVGNGSVDDTAAIQKALDAGVGKSVYVPAGTYRVRPLWERTVTTLNLDPQATLVLAPGSDATLLTITAPGATVTGSGTLDGNRGAQTRGAGGAGIRVGAAGDVTVRGIRIVNTVQYGIYAANVANLDISGISISAPGYVGIFADATWGTVSNLVIENSRVDCSSEPTSDMAGIVVHRTGATGSVSGIRLSGNTVLMPKGQLDSPLAIVTHGVQGAIIQRNKTAGGAMGISLDTTTNGLVTSNTVSGASLYGIELAASRATTVSMNTVDCGGYTPQGIVLDNDAPTNNNVSDNTITGCVNRGIWLNTGSDRATISGNQITQSKGYAILIVRSAAVAVTDNVVEGNGSALRGIDGETSLGLTVAGNRISDFVERSVLLYRADGAALTDNQINQSRGYGVHIISTNGIVLTDNVVAGAGSALKALIVDTCSTVTITRNVMSRFTQHGVLLYGASPAVLDLITITRNTFSSTTVAYGIQLSGGATLGKVVFSNNTIT